MAFSHLFSTYLGLTGAIEQGREDNGYSGGGAGSVDKTSDQDYRDWVSGIVNVGG